jgi:hypothetical protein
VFHVRALYYTKTLITDKFTKRVLSSIVTHSYMFRPCWVIFRENFFVTVTLGLHFMFEWECAVDCTALFLEAWTLCGPGLSGLTPWSRVLTEELTGPHLVKKFPASYGNRRFITAFTRASHLSLSWAISIQSTLTPSRFSKIYFNIILQSTPGSYFRLLRLYSADGRWMKYWWHDTERGNPKYLGGKSVSLATTDSTGTALALNTRFFREIWAFFLKTLPVIDSITLNVW